MSVKIWSCFSLFYRASYFSLLRLSIWQESINLVSTQ